METSRIQTRKAEPLGSSAFTSAGNSIEARPRLVVLSSLFPHPGQPQAGIFIRERMFRVAQELPLTVVAPVPWFPFQRLLRIWRPHFRPPAPRHERQNGIDVFHPRFLSIPGAMKSWDGLFMALGSRRIVRQLNCRSRCDLIDAHFAYPDGYAATLLGKWLGRPVSITLRGTEVPLSRTYFRRRLMVKAMRRADRVFSVADFLKRLAMSLGVRADKIRTIGNGVDMAKFHRVDREQARRQLGLNSDGPVLITVGGLTERKGFHRIIEVLPQLRKRFPGLTYLIVGGASAEGDWGDRLRQLVSDLRLEDAVQFVGTVVPTELKFVLSAADAFVLASRNEGWANVLLEAMACGLPVVATDVGGNREVLRDESLGKLVPFGDPNALQEAIAEVLETKWDGSQIAAYAEKNSWDVRVETLIEELGAIYFRKQKHRAVGAATVSENKGEI